MLSSALVHKLLVNEGPQTGDPESGPPIEVKSSPSTNWKRIGAVSIVAATGAVAWVVSDNFFGNDNYTQGKEGLELAGAMVFRYVVNGAAQTAGNFIANLVPAHLEITTPWSKWDAATVFLNNTNWGFLSELGKWMAPNSWATFISCPSTLGLGQLGATGLMSKFQSWWGTKPADKKTPSLLSEITSSISFWFEGPIDLSFIHSPANVRTCLGSSFFAGIGAGLGQFISDKWEARKQRPI